MGCYFHLCYLHTAILHTKWEDILHSAVVDNDILGQICIQEAQTVTELCKTDKK